MGGFWVLIKGESTVSCGLEGVVAGDLAAMDAEEEEEEAVAAACSFAADRGCVYLFRSTIDVELPRLSGSGGTSGRSRSSAKGIPDRLIELALEW